MQIVINSRTQFFQRDKTTDKDGNETLVVKNTVTLAPSVLPQDAPSWIVNDPLFGLMVKDGTLIQIQAVAQTATQADPPSAQTGKPTGKAAEDTGASNKGK